MYFVCVYIIFGSQGEFVRHRERGVVDPGTWVGFWTSSMYCNFQGKYISTIFPRPKLIAVHRKVSSIGSYNDLLLPGHRLLAQIAVGASGDTLIDVMTHTAHNIAVPYYESLQGFVTSQRGPAKQMSMITKGGYCAVNPPATKCPREALRSERATGALAIVNHHNNRFYSLDDGLQ